MKRVVVLVLVLLIAFFGVFSHALIASSHMDSKITAWGKAVGIDWIGQSSMPELAVPVVLMDSELIHVAGNGVYNFEMTMLDEHGEEIGHLSPVWGAIMVALAPDEAMWGVFVPFPFLIPFVLHLVLVWLVPVVARISMARSNEYAVNPSGSGVLVSAVYAYFIMIVFQITRMVWGSQMWAVDSYLNSFAYGWQLLYVIFGLSIAMYFYCVIGSAGLQVRRKPSAKKQTCIKCGYGVEGIEGKCPECDLEIGAFVPSKWRINHLYLAGMFVVTFFSPVMVASVYSVLG